jgi:hypothetical protein
MFKHSGNIQLTFTSHSVQLPGHHTSLNNVGVLMYRPPDCMIFSYYDNINNSRKRQLFYFILFNSRSSRRWQTPGGVINRVLTVIWARVHLTAHIHYILRLTSITSYGSHPLHLTAHIHYTARLCPHPGASKARVSYIRCSTSREHSGNILGTFREHSVHIQFTFSSHSVHIQFTFSSHSVHIQFTFSSHSGNIQFTFSSHSGNIQ